MTANGSRRRSASWRTEWPIHKPAAVAPTMTRKSTSASTQVLSPKNIDDLLARPR
ncbi:MAG TPA: hypothetical protein VI357_14665 [Mycobacteriales bacterium]